MRLKKPLKPCAMIGCPALVRGSERYCEKHKKEFEARAKRRQRERGNDKFGWFYKSKSWRETRDLFLERHPLCQRCFSLGILQKAEHVHHIVPLSEGGDSSDENLQALCSSCHVRVEHARKKTKDP